MVPLCSTTPYKEYRTLVFSSATFFQNEQNSKISSSPIYRCQWQDHFMQRVANVYFENVEIKFDLDYDFFPTFTQPTEYCHHGLMFLLLLLENHHCCFSARIINQRPLAAIAVSWPRYLNNWTCQFLYESWALIIAKYLNSATSPVPP